MSLEPAITVEGLWKRYRIGTREPRAETLAALLLQAAGRPLRTLRQRWWVADSADEMANTLWALRDISFTVAQGEVLGVIGHNGAGKSTLLKVLSRITDPTRGRITLRGRVGSLLEVGTGFHGDLTGRENIYLSGAILGMRRHEINSRFDDIVAFAGVEVHVDTPVKRYSSGMYLRLAFAVAAHLDPEILLVDEVLAVGDQAFQKRCLEKIGEIAGGGRTVLFVSHNLSSISELCPRSLMIDHGEVTAWAPTGEVVQQYLSAQQMLLAEYRPPQGRRGDFELLELAVTSAAGEVRPHYPWDERFDVRMRYRLHAPIPDLRVGFSIETAMGQVVLRSGDSDYLGDVQQHRGPGEYISTGEIPARLLNEGDYLVSVRVDRPRAGWVFREDRVARLSIGAPPLIGGSYHAIVHPALAWHHQPTTWSDPLDQGSSRSDSKS